MPINYPIVTEKIKSAFDINNENQPGKKIILLSGSFASGKSECLAQFCQGVKDTSLASAIYYMNTSNLRFLVDLPENFNIEVIDENLNDIHIVNEEIAYNRQKLNYILEIVNNINRSLTERLYSHLSLKSGWEYFFAQKSDYSADKLGKELEKILEKKSYLNYVTNLEELVSESFIVDLMNTYYPSASESGLSQAGPDKPLKILFVMDDYDHLSGNIDNWLLRSFFDYCFDKPLKEFKYYEISHANETSRAADFFDFRFIIAGRSPLKNYTADDRSFDYSAIAETIDFRPLDADGIRQYLDGKGFVAGDNAVSIENLTHGLPGLIDLLVDSGLSGNPEAASLAVNEAAFDLLFRYSNSFEKSVITSASFLEVITPEGLKCFSELKPLAMDLFFLLTETPLLTEKNSIGEVSVRPYIRNIISKALKLHEPELAVKNEKIALIINDLRHLFDGLSPRESEAARNLAYFDRFDMNFNIEKAYQNDAVHVSSLISKKSEWFIKDKFTYRLNDEIRNKFIDYNRLVDNERFDDKQALTSSIWNEYASGLKTQINEMKNEIPALNKRLAEAEKKIIKGKQKHNELQSQYMDVENSLIDVRKKLSLYSPQTYFSHAGINLIIAAAVFVVAMFLPGLFDKGTNHTAIGTSSIILMIIAGIFASIGIVHIARFINKRSNKSDMSALNHELKSREEEKADYLAGMNQVKDSNDALQKQIFEINDSLRRLKSELSVLKEKFNPKQEEGR